MPLPDINEDTQIWSTPLSDNEEAMIKEALEGYNYLTIKRWCHHLLKMAVAQREVAKQDKPCEHKYLVYNPETGAECASCGKHLVNVEFE